MAKVDSIEGGDDISSDASIVDAPGTCDKKKCNHWSDYLREVLVKSWPAKAID